MNNISNDTCSNQCSLKVLTTSVVKVKCYPRRRVQNKTSKCLFSTALILYQNSILSINVTEMVMLGSSITHGYIM